jgi:hypothetical protein
MSWRSFWIASGLASLLGALGVALLVTSGVLLLRRERETDLLLRGAGSESSLFSSYQHELIVQVGLLADLVRYTDC